MEKQCSCGSIMELELRTIMYGRNVQIHHVPVYHCEVCKRNEVHNRIKPLLKGVIKGIDNEPTKQKLYFDKFSEFTDVLVQLSKSKKDKSELQKLLDNRVNHLLDLMNVAQNAQDQEWLREIEDRLQQVICVVDSTYSA
jgi:hypothetical protein